MSNIGSTILSLLGAACIVSLLVGVMMLFHMIQQAFVRSGVRWGLISSVYPPGTYLYCRRNWEQYGPTFRLVSWLIAVAIILWLIVRFS